MAFIQKVIETGAAIEQEVNMAGTIAFASLAPRGWDLYVTDVKTLQSRRLTDHPALDYNGVFSPDGKDRLRLGARRQPGAYTIGRTAPTYGA